MLTEHSLDQMSVPKLKPIKQLTSTVLISQSVCLHQNSRSKSNIEPAVRKCPIRTTVIHVITEKQDMQVKRMK